MSNYMNNIIIEKFRMLEYDYKRPYLVLGLLHVQYTGVGYTPSVLYTVGVTHHLPLTQMFSGHVNSNIITVMSGLINLACLFD